MWLVLRVLVCLGTLVLSVISQAQPMAASPQEAHWQQLTAQAQELHRQGRYAEAMPVAQEALALAEAIFGPAHLHVAASRHTLARLAHALGQYADAEALFQQALTQREHLLGPDHPEVAQSLHDLRASLDHQTNPALALGELLPVDVAMAHQLYQQLFAPLREALMGVTHLLVVPDDVLLPLPFGVLITDASGNAYAQLATLYHHRHRRAPTPAELAIYADVAWLAKDYALTVLPSATALRALRHLRRASVPAHEPLVGFGDPVLVGTTACSQHRDTMLPTRSTDTTLEAVRQLCPLPHTRAELHAMAQELGADPAQALYVGAQATRPMVHALNQSGRLGAAQVLAFSTHGLIAGAVTRGSQPAPVLTPPVSASAEDNGLLSLDEIVQLTLPATEWVILSACNTAAADGSGEGLSGLVRAFFFAGAPALLVSHWSVDVQATAALMTAIFRHYGDAPERSRAEALRQGILPCWPRQRRSGRISRIPLPGRRSFWWGKGEC